MFVTNGDEAEKMFSSHKYDLVIYDVGIKSFDKLLNGLKKVKNLIIYTGEVEPDYIIEKVGREIYERSLYLMKPEPIFYPDKICSPIKQYREKQTADYEKARAILESSQTLKTDTPQELPAIVIFRNRNRRNCLVTAMN